MPKALRIIIYPIFFAGCVVLFTLLLFPFDSLKNRVARELEGAMGGRYQITIGNLSPSPLSGAVLKNVELRPRGEPSALPVKISQAKLKFGVFPLLSGTVEVDFDLKLAQGKASGAFAWKRGGIEVDAKLDRFDLALASFLTKDVGVPLTGIVSGTVDLELYPQDPLRNAGKVSLQVIDLNLGEIEVGDGAFTIPSVKLAQAGGSRIEVQISRGNFDVKAVNLTGGDLTLETNGKIYGARKADNYRFNLKGSFRVSEGLAQKLQILSLVEKQKTAEGAYPFTITGRVLKPSIRIGDFKLPI